MPNDALVTPLAFTLPRAMDNRSQELQHITPKFMPCTISAINGELVTVNFEVSSKFTLPKVEIPQAFSAWARLPSQVGDKGYAVPADYYMGGQSGQGGGTADLYPRGNLTNLVFVHNSQVNFPTNPTRNLNAGLSAGPQGWVIKDSGNNCVFTLATTGITITIGGCTVTITSAGLTVTGGDVVNNSLTIGSTHVHNGVTSGGALTGPPSP